MSAWQPAERYPDPAVVAVDSSFERYRVRLTAVERLATGNRWAEGPVWFGDGRYLLWSDIPNNRIRRWCEQTGEVSTFRSPSDFANGNTRDRSGRLVTCEHGARRVTRTEYDGAVSVLADSVDGQPLNSPNDVVVDSAGAVWFTDPTFGILGYYEGYRAEPSLPTRVYRVDPNTGVITAVTDALVQPNGLAFAPDESLLYIVESRGPKTGIFVFDVVDGGRALGAGRQLIDAEGGTPDGLRVDVDGNLWCGWGEGRGSDGVRIFNPDGRLIGRIDLPERCANVCFGGRWRNRLFMAASRSVYSLYVNTQGTI
jgi:gluconolactonase